MFDFGRDRWEFLAIDFRERTIAECGNIRQFENGVILDRTGAPIGRYRPVPDEPRRFRFEFDGERPYSLDVFLVTEDRFVAIKEDEWNRRWELHLIGRRGA